MSMIYTSGLFGGTLTTVPTFGALPTVGKVDQRIFVTGEWATFSVAAPVIVCWNNISAKWELESARAIYLKIAEAEFNSGTWTGTGGTVGTKNGARIADSTYSESWIWNSTSNIFTPDYLNLTTVANQKTIKGDSVTPSGWTSNLTIGASTRTTDGSKLSFYAESLGGQTHTSSLSFDDAGRTLTSNFYMKCLIQRNNSTNFEMGTTGQIQMYFQYRSGPASGRAVEFGDYDTIQGVPIGGTGVFYSRVGTATKYTPTGNRGDILTTETLLQFRVMAGNIVQVKVGNGGWHDMAMVGFRALAGTSFEIGTLSSNSPTNKAECKIRYLQAIRYT
jgi:hypothetical protein